MNNKCPKCGAESWTEFSWQCSSSKNGNYIAPWCRIRELEATVAERDATIAELERDAEHLRVQVVAGTKSRDAMYVTIASLRECLKNALLDPLRPTTRAIIQRRLEVSE